MNPSSSTHEGTPFSAATHSWAQYRVWAATSRELKAQLTSWQLRVLVLTLVGAILGTLSQQFAGWGWVSNFSGWGSAIALGTAAFFGREILKPDKERHWVRARSAAEAYKSQTYLFLANAPPYDKDDKVKVLFNKTDQLYKSVKELQETNISDEMKHKGLPSDPLSINDYMHMRVNDQIQKYYRPQAAKHATVVKRGSAIGLVLGVLAVALGALEGSGISKFTAVWIAVVTTATTAVGSYLYAGRHQYLVISYQATARRLEWLHDRWQASGKSDSDTEERNQFICNCEDAISVENSDWMAEWDKQERSGR